MCEWPVLVLMNMIGSSGSLTERKRASRTTPTMVTGTRPDLVVDQRARGRCVPTASAGLRKPSRRAASSLMTMLPPRAASARSAAGSCGKGRVMSSIGRPSSNQRPATICMPHRVEEALVDLHKCRSSPARCDPGP